MDWSTYTQAQKECIQHVDGPLFVSAGAGSGKTFTLQQRIAYALLPESGPFLDSIDQVLAITFTQKAAAEIQGRVRSALRGEGLFEQALQVDNAWISTIHGMCSRILKENAFEFGLDPRFGILPPNEEEGLLRLAFACVVDYIQDPDQETCQAFLASMEELRIPFAFNPDLAQIDLSELNACYTIDSMQQNTVWSMVSDIIGKVSNTLDGFDSIDLGPRPYSPCRSMQEFLDATHELMALTECAMTTSKATTLESMHAELEAYVEELEAGVANPSLGIQEAYELIAKSPNGEKRAASVKEAVDVYRAVKNWALGELSVSYARTHMQQLVSIARQTKEVYDCLLRSESLMDNASLIHSCYAALLAHPEVAERYRRHFKLAMIDEFQDTDELQLKLISLLVDERYLCTVGDAQQSIYRFRGADVGVFNRLAEKVVSQNDGLLQKLDYNFRSHADILSLVRIVCGQDEIFGKDFLDLQPRRRETGAYKGSTPRLGILGSAYANGSGISKQDALQREAEGIASEFARLQREGHEPREMVILLGRLSNVDVYARALREQGLQTLVIGGGGFYAQEEVQAVEALLRYLADSYDSEALFTLLQSSVMRISNDELLRLVSEPSGVGMYKPRNLDQAFEALERKDSDNVRHIKCLLRRARKQLAYSKPSQICTEFFENTGFFENLDNAGSAGMVEAANVLKAIRIIEDLEGRTGGGIVAVSDAFSGLIAQGVREPQGSLSVEGQNAVSIMTIHRSKGLEFPIVALAEYDGDSKTTKSYTSVLFTDSLGVPHVGLGASLQKAMPFDKIDPELMPAHLENSAVYWQTQLCAYDDLAEKREAYRKLYVALTRASEYLLIASPIVSYKKSGLRTGRLFEAVVDGIMLHENPGQAHAALEEGTSLSLLPISDEPQLICSSPEVYYLHQSLCNDADKQADERDYSEEQGFQGGREKVEECVPHEEDWERIAYDGAPLHEGEGSYDQLEQEVATDPLFALHTTQTPRAFVSFSKLLRASQLVPVEVEEATTLEECDSLEVSTLEAHEGRGEQLAEQGEVALGDTAGYSAVDFGSAFHRLAQYMVATRREDGSLVLPDDDRIRARAQYYKLGDVGYERLLQACEQWAHSAVCAQLASYDQLEAELPFVIALKDILPEACSKDIRELSLEGEIDLLCHSDIHQGLIIDYKTGGHQGETLEHLQEKHRLQASCYALAVLLQGFEQVDVVFVRVEQIHDKEPQTVKYSFGQDDTPELIQLLTQACETYRDYTHVEGSF